MTLGRPTRFFSRKRLFLTIASGLIIGGLATYIGLNYLPKPQPKSPAPTTQQASKKQEVVPKYPTLSLAAMGDMLAHDSVVSQAQKNDSYNFAPYFSYIRPVYKNSDVVFCNSETLTTGAEFGISGYPAFNAPKEFARDLKEAGGCNLINLATNHMNDKGQKAIDANINVWKDLDVLAYAGANSSMQEQTAVRYFTKNDIKVAFVAFADFSNNKDLTPYGINLYHDTELVKNLLGEARKNADVVIVSAHWGTEDSATINPDQTAAAQLFADNGADVVIGTGPHVLQKTSYLTGSNGKKTLVWYSVGNMLSSQLKINELTSGIAGFDIIKKNNAISIENISFKSTFMSYDWSAADKAAEKLSTRTNLQLRPLKDADASIKAMFGDNYSSEERLEYIRTTLGDNVKIALQ